MSHLTDADQRRTTSSLPRLILTGPESTGKSALAHALIAKLNGVLVEEYLRGYFAERGAVGLVDAIPIAKGQWHWEKDGANRAEKISAPLVCDSDLISSCVYNSHYYADQIGSEIWQDWQIWRDKRLERLKNPPFAPRLYLLCGIDWPWVEDLQRDAPHLRGHFYDLFRGELDRQGFDFMELRGSLDERLDQVLKYLAEL